MSVSPKKLILRRPSLADQDTVLGMVTEFASEESAMDGGFYRIGEDYIGWLERMQLAEIGLGIPEGFVPYIQLVSFDEAGQAVGFLNLRLRLNDALLKKGGHIGYSIRPSQRGKGYAKEQLRLGLQEALSKNISRILVTCDEANGASKRTILACGGRLEDAQDGTQRYWIEN